MERGRTLIQCRLRLDAPHQRGFPPSPSTSVRCVNVFDNREPRGLRRAARSSLRRATIPLVGGISVIVATRNRAGLLAGCLRALSAQLLRPAQVVVVDDESRDDTSVLLEREDRAGRLPLAIVRMARNVGPAAARNRGLAIATGDFIAFTDDDCEPATNWLAALSAAFLAGDHRLAGVGGRVLPAHPGLVADYMTFHRILEPPPSCSYLVTANCMYRRAALDRVGGFDERVKTPGGEDPGLAWALRRHGYCFSFCEDAVVRHHYRESIGDFLRTFYRYGRGCRVVVG